MNIYILIPIIFLSVVGIAALIMYLIDMSKEKRMTVLKEWLLLAVIQAEKELGGGTGQVKLRYVYDMFITKFTWLSKMISFDTFSFLVDESLDKMRSMIEENVNLQEYINK